MAKIKFGVFASDVRGKLNGSVFARNRGGAYVRTKVTPLNPKSSRQIEVRARLTALAQGFRSLSQDQISAWNNAVTQWQRTDVFGDLVSPTGLALYVRLNGNLLNAGQAIISDVPAPGSVDQVSSLTLTGDESSSTLSLAATPAAVPADTTLIIEATEPLSLGINNANSKFRYIGSFAAASASPYNLATMYQAKFGTIKANQKIFIRAKYVNNLTGQTSLALASYGIPAI